MSQDNDAQALQQDELATLKARADMLKIDYHPSIGLEKLRVKVAAAMADDPKDADKNPPAAALPVAAPEVESDHARLRRLKREAHELVRIRITNMNPSKKDWEGEIFTVGNSLIGTISKFVPFNSDEGWHVPRIMYEQLIARQCQVFVTLKTKGGVSVRQGKLIKEFGIEVMPALTADEIHDLAQRQAMSKSID